MGVRYGRAYRDIIADLAQALNQMGDCYELLDLNRREWELFDENEQQAVIQTLADDVFYGLGCGQAVRLGRGRIRHLQKHHAIILHDGHRVIRVVYLV